MLSPSRLRFLLGLKRALPLALPLLAFGISFGLVARQAGLSAEAALAMSLTTFAGGAQFAAIGTLASGGGILAACLGATLLNSRYLAMGLALAPAIPGPAWRRWLAAHLLVDESWLLSRNRRGRHHQELYWAVGLAEFLLWGLGTALGIAFASRLPTPERLGVDMAVNAFFLALLWPQLQDRGQRRAALAGAALALVLLPLGHPGLALLLTPLLVMALAWKRSANDA